MKLNATLLEIIEELDRTPGDTPVKVDSSLSGPRWTGIRSFIEEAALLNDVGQCQITESKGLFSTSCTYKLEGCAYDIRRACTSIYNGMKEHGLSSKNRLEKLKAA